MGCKPLVNPYILGQHILLWKYAGFMSRLTRNSLWPRVRRKIAIACSLGVADIAAMDLDIFPTAILAVVFALFAGVSGYMGARAPDPKRGPRMMPWRFLMLLAVVALLLLVVHLLTLLGLKHDQPLHY